MSVIVKNRRNHLLKYIFEKEIASKSGLEIGPYNQPTIFKSEAKIYYLDYRTRAQLVETCKEEHLIDAIPETDYIVSSDNYSITVKDKFDYIIANHVLEHIANPIKWLTTINDMLNEGGILFLALPDKKFTFDKYRNDTQLSHILYDYFTDEVNISQEHQLEIELFYDLEFVKKEMIIEERLDSNRLSSAISKKPHIGIHCHVFQSETFLNQILKPILFMNLAAFNILDFFPSKDNYGEFIVILKKEKPSVFISASEFYRGITEEGKNGQQHAYQVEYNKLLTEYNALINSRSWKLTRPLRAIVGLLLDKSKWLLH